MRMTHNKNQDVIPAKAGIQTGSSDIRELRLDSRFRGNDVVEKLAAALCVVAFLFLGSPVMAQDHPMHGVALVIGESKYEQLPVLTNPSKDARDIDRLLGDLGFDVTRVLNADGDKMRDAISQFEDDAKDADVALIYYSGHGIEAKGANFIAPTDTDLSSPQSAGDSMIAVQPILDELAKVVPVSIILLDACRSDPFPPGQMVVLPGDTTPTPVDGQGLAPVRGPTPVAIKSGNPDSFGSVLGFSASPGEPALDGPPGENSPYAAALLKQFAAGGYSFGDVMTLVSNEVYLNTDAKQLPWTNSSLRQVLSFGAPVEDDADADQSAIKTERRKLLLSIAGTPGPTQKYVEQLAGQEKVPLASLYGMLNALGIKATDNSGDLQDQLQKGAERLKELIANKPEPVKSDAELERLSKLADDAEGEGAIALALKYRDQASARADILLKGKQDEAAKLRLDMIDIAGTYASNAATASLNFDHLHAAELYGKAFDAVKDWDRAKALGFKISQGDALTDQGYYTIDNGALTTALAVYAEALELAPKDSDPLGWGKIENRIGQAQQTLGARLGDQKMLQDSVASFREALTEQTQTAAPDAWAGAQNNLGNALYSLGQRTDDQAVLQQAIDAFQASLSVYTRAADPAHWSTVQSNMGGAQMALADVIYGATKEIQFKALDAGNNDVDNLPEVVVARDKSVAILTTTEAQLQAALAARPRGDSPLDWAMIQHALASVLADRAKLTNSADDFKAAAVAYRAVLEVHDKVKTPAQWVRSASNLAIMLRQYSSLIKDSAPLAEAADLLKQAIELTPRDQAELDWAELQSKLGNVLSDMAGFDGKGETADAAIAAYRLAAEVTTPERDLDGWRGLQVNIIQVDLTLGVATKDVPRLKIARDVAAQTAAAVRATNSEDADYFEGLVQKLDPYIAKLSK